MVFKDTEPEYYLGSTCQNYWLCFNGLQYPEITCPDGTVFDTTFNGCVNTEYGRCPEDDLAGYLSDQLIFPEYHFDRTCSIRSNKGDYEFILENELVYNPALCEYRQILTFCLRWLTTFCDFKLMLANVDNVWRLFANFGDLC